MTYTALADLRHKIENERRMEDEIRKQMVLPREQLEAALENNLSVLRMLRKSYIQLKLTVSEDEVEEQRKEWPGLDNFKMRYDIILITKEVCAVRFGEGT